MTLINYTNCVSKSYKEIKYVLTPLAIAVLDNVDYKELGFVYMRYKRDSWRKSPLIFKLLNINSFKLFEMIQHNNNLS